MEMNTSLPLTSARASLDAALNACGKSRAQAAKEIGCRANVLSMMRTGAMEIPVTRAGAIARAVGLDEVVFTLQVIRDNNADLFRALEPMLARDKYEAALLQVMRLRKKREDKERETAAARDK